MLKILLTLPSLRPKRGSSRWADGASWPQRAPGHGPGSHVVVIWPSRVETLPKHRIREGLWSESVLRSAPRLTEGESLLCSCSRGERHLSCLTYLWVIFRGRERWPGKEGTSSPVLLAAQAGPAPSPQLLRPRGDPRRLQRDPSTWQGCCRPPAADPGGSRRAPASFSEVVGEM